ncbi:hypothetical protein AN958_05950 [Leucoagaricus sp. SymC.cos]|nr:hypothetical protein AN958_05950 [Leucoagaricus sp. SymC.cos]
MQLKPLIFFASIISTALATANLQDLLADASNIGVKAVHNQVNEAINMVEKAVKTTKELDGRVETETAQHVLNSFHELVPLVQAACKAINVQAILGSVGQQGAAVAKLDVLYLMQAILELEDAALSRVPLDCIEEARGFGDEIKAALNVAIVAFD